MNIVQSENEERVLPVLLSEPVSMKKNDVFCHQMASGGGYGNALERDPAHVLKDVLEDKVTIGGARQDYGVVIAKEDNGYVVDDNQTIMLRKELTA